MDDEIRIEAVQRIVDTWKPRDKEGQQSKKRFEDQLKDFTESESEDDVELTTSAVVLGPQGTLLHTYDPMPSWVTPGGKVGHNEHAWDAAQRKTQEKTGVAVHHPDDGPQLIDIDLQHKPDGGMKLDVRFLLFADIEELPERFAKVSTAKWFTDAAAKDATGETFRRALEVAHALRDEATR